MPKQHTPASIEQDVDCFNQYLAAGHGKGRLLSKATVYDGKVGYFSVYSVQIDGVRQDAIMFSCMPHQDIMITAIPPLPQTFVEAKRISGSVKG